MTRETDRSEAVAALAALLREHAESIWPAQLRATADGGGWDIHEHAARFVLDSMPALRPEREEAGLREVLLAALDEADENEKRDIEWWARGGKGMVAFDHTARNAARGLLDRPERKEAGLLAALLRIFDLAENRPDIREVARAALRGTGAEPERPSLDVRIDAYLDDRLVPCPDPTAHEESDRA